MGYIVTIRGNPSRTNSTTNENPNWPLDGGFTVLKANSPNGSKMLSKRALTGFELPLSVRIPVFDLRNHGLLRFRGDRDMTDKVTLNYLLIYALVPYYLFFNVLVTSSWIPGWTHCSTRVGIRCFMLSMIHLTTPFQASMSPSPSGF